jgi:transcription initiation factor TFIIB
VQGKLSGKITKPSSPAKLVLQPNKMAAPGAPSPGLGSENQPPEPAYRQNLNTRLICPDCKLDPPQFIEENADTICANCGLVLAERLISMESEWRTFNSDESRGDDPNRVGEADNELLGVSNVGTTIGSSANSSKESKRLKRAQNQQVDEKKDKELMSAYQILDTWSERAQLTPTVKQLAKRFYKSVHDANAFRGKSRDAVLASCLFIACRQLSFGRSFTEMFGLTNVTKKDIGRTFKQLQKFLQDNNEDKIKEIEGTGGVISRENMQLNNTSSTKPEVLIERFSSQLGYKFRVTSIAKEIAKKTPSLPEIAGRSPLSIAAASLYFATNLIKFPATSIKDIQPVAGVSEGTIRVSYKLLYAVKDQIIDRDWLGPQPGGQGHGKIENLPAN